MADEEKTEVEGLTEKDREEIRSLLSSISSRVRSGFSIDPMREFNAEIIRVIDMVVKTKVSDERAAGDRRVAEALGIAETRSEVARLRARFVEVALAGLCADSTAVVEKIPESAVWIADATLAKLAEPT